MSAAAATTPASRTPPHNVDAEKSVLGAVFIKPAIFDEIATSLAADDFFFPANRQVFEVMLTLDQRRQSIDVLTVADQLKTAGLLSRLDGGAAYLNDLANATPTAENVGNYARIVKQKANARRLIAACAEVQSRAYGDFVMADEEAKLLAVTRSRSVTLELPPTIGQRSGGVMADIEERARLFASGASTITGARTGIDPLDRATCGFQEGHLIAIAAATGGGKTSLALQAGINVALDGGAALFITLEMSTAELIERALGHVGAVNSTRVRTGNIGDAWPDLQAAEKRLAPTGLSIEDNAATIGEICASARRWRARNADVPGLVVVDYLQLVASERVKGQNRAQEIGQIAQQLKALAREVRVPVVVLSQLNRAGVKADRPSKTDLRESGDIENACDLIVLIWNKTETGDDDVVLLVDKNRFGQKLEVPARWVGRHYKFTNRHAGGSAS